MIKITIVPKFIRDWWRYNRMVRSKSDLEPFAQRLFECGKYGWDRRWAPIYERW